MHVERFDGTKEKKEFESRRAMMVAALALGDDPTVKKITLIFPKPLIPGGKKRKK
jgi:hypothetical protein